MLVRAVRPRARAVPFPAGARDPRGPRQPGRVDAMRAIVVTEFGGPEVLVPTDVPEPVPDLGQLLVSVDRAGVNYADTHQPANPYLSPTQLPMVPGGEVVGRTPDGRRVVAMVAGGGYAERAV